MDVSGKDKGSLRRALRAVRQNLSAGEEGRLRCLRMQKRLLESRLWQTARRVLLYVAVKGEADTAFLLADAWRCGREVWLPRCRPEEPGVMDMIACSGEEELTVSSFGIPEPRLHRDTKVLSAAECGPETLVVVPALAFDRQGFRIGYGGGYYDRLLARAGCASVGLAFHELLFDRLPHEDWDIPAGAVCTEEELLCLRI